MEKMNNLRDLLKHELEDLRSAEDQITAALPKMIEKAKNAKLKQSLQQHLKVTEQQIRRLDRMDEMMKGGESESREGKGFLGGLFGGGSHHCKGMEGIITEGEKIMKEDMDPDVMDAAIIASCQKVEHYEICGYGTARAFARELGLRDVERLLTETLDEEYEADDLLTNLAVVGGLNEEAKARRNRRGSSGQGNASGRSKSASKSGRSKSASKSSGSRSKAASKAGSKSSGSRSKAASKSSGGRSKTASKGGSKKAASRGGASKTGGRSKAASKSRTKSASKSSGRSKAASKGGRKTASKGRR